jgi:hypothetical protein
MDLTNWSLCVFGCAYVCDREIDREDMWVWIVVESAIR